MMKSLGRAVLGWVRGNVSSLVFCTVVIALALSGSVALADPSPMLPVVFLLGSIAPLVTSKTRQQLEAISNPQVTGQSEAVPWVLFDTQTYTSAATTTLDFFADQQADRTLSNMLQGGALTDPQWFEIWNLGLDILNDLTTAAGTEAGILDDIQKLILVGRPIWTLTISDKNYGPFPVSFLHTSGGALGFGWGTFTAEESIQYGNNSVPDGGWNWRGAVVIPPKVGFRVTLTWAAAQTLAGGNPPLRFWMAGALHRRIL